MVSARPLRLIVEGIGNVVQEYYAEPLKEICETYNGKVEVTFVDDSQWWCNVPEIKKSFVKFRRYIKRWAKYIDKHTENDKYNKLQADTVFIATPDHTHVDIVLKHWLRRSSQNTQIFIEKPLDASLDKARDLLFQIKEDDPNVRALDHYRARILTVITNPGKQKYIWDKLGGRIISFDFYFLYRNHVGRYVKVQR